MKGFWTALSFLTVFPVRKPGDHEPADFSRSAVWFPFVGILIGSVLVGFNWLLSLGVPDGIRSVLVLMLWVVLSGGLHLDGLADSLDGLFASTTVERRLEILRDSRTGAFAVIGMVLFLMMKAAALEFLFEPSALLLAPAAGRAAMLLGGLFPGARPGGLGAVFRDGLSPAWAAGAAVLPLTLALLLGTRGILALAAAALTALLVYSFSRARIGGVTGDVFGAACELAELAVLFFFMVN